jgi:hypothetical protein
MQEGRARGNWERMAVVVGWEFINPEIAKIEGNIEDGRPREVNCFQFHSSDKSPVQGYGLTRADKIHLAAHVLNSLFNSP